MTGHEAQLLGAAAAGIAVVVILISWLSVHPFLALILGSGVLGLIAGYGPSDTVTSFVDGVGATRRQCRHPDCTGRDDRRPTR